MLTIDSMLQVFDTCYVSNTCTVSHTYNADLQTPQFSKHVMLS